MDEKTLNAIYKGESMSIIKTKNLVILLICITFLIGGYYFYQKWYIKNYLSWAHEVDFSSISEIEYVQPTYDFLYNNKNHCAKCNDIFNNYYAYMTLWPPVCVCGWMMCIEHMPRHKLLALNYANIYKYPCGTRRFFYYFGPAIEEVRSINDMYLCGYDQCECSDFSECLKKRIKIEKCEKYLFKQGILSKRVINDGILQGIISEEVVDDVVQYIIGKEVMASGNILQASGTFLGHVSITLEGNDLNFLLINETVKDKFNKFHKTKAKDGHIFLKGTIEIRRTKIILTGDDAGPEYDLYVNVEDFEFEFEKAALK